MHIQELTIEVHIRTLRQLLAQFVEITGNQLEELRIANDIFLYLYRYPSIVRDHSNFRNTVQRKMTQLFVDTERVKRNANPASGVVNHPLLHAATNLENSMNILRQQM
jgi:hypothetical protein